MRSWLTGGRGLVENFNLKPSIMSDRRESGQDLYIDPASLTRRGSLDLSTHGQDFDLNHSLTFPDPSSTVPTQEPLTRIPHRLSVVHPSLTEEQPNVSYPQFGSVSYPSPLDFRRPDLPRDLKSSLQVGHGSSVPYAAPWTSVAVVDQPMTDLREQSFGGARQQNQGQPTDSGYASSLKSNFYASSQSYMTPYTADPQHINSESREVRMQQVLPDQTSMFSRKASHIGSDAKSVTSYSDNAPDPDDLTCDRCSIPFSTKSEYRKHMARHEKKFKCEVPNCKKIDGFATQNDLDRHLKSVHHLLDPEAKVWKCFVESCKSAGKIWPRQDNFKAHIGRMHKDADVNEYVRQSDSWFENVEKPQGQAQRTGGPTFPGNLGANSLDLNTGNIQRYPGTISVPSLNEQLNSRHSVGGEFPSSGMDPYSPFNPVPVTFSRFQLPISLIGTTDNVRSLRNNLNTSISNMMAPTNPYHLRGISIPAIRADDMSEHPGDNPFYPHNSDWDNKTMPEMGRFDEPFPSSWSPSADIDKHAGEGMTALTQADNNMFSYMGPLDASSLPASDAISQLIIDLPSHGTQAPSIFYTPDAEDDRAEELRLKVAEAVSKIHGLDSELVQKLAKVLQEHSSSHASTSVKENSTTGDVEADKPYACERDGCTKRFAKKNVRAKHQKRHDKRWFCTFDDCYKRFGSKQDMQRHEVTCNTQEECWRCWCRQGSRAANNECATFCTDSRVFEKHCKDKHYGYSRRSTEDFKVEREFAGSFWCGFCNAVFPNPIDGGYDGTARLKYRYDHIDKHLDDEKTMADWYDLKGEGKTKGEKRDSLKKIITVTTNDEDDDEADEDELDIGGQAPATSSSGSRRQRSETAPRLRPQYLAPPSSGSSQGMKRPSPGGIDYSRDIASQKMPRLHQSQSASRRSNPSDRRAPVMVTRPNDLVVAWIRCCACPSPRPRPNDGKKACPIPGCTHQVCSSCRFWARNGTPLVVPQHPT